MTQDFEDTDGFFLLFFLVLLFVFLQGVVNKRVNYYLRLCKKIYLQARTFPELGGVGGVV